MMVTSFFFLDRKEDDEGESHDSARGTRGQNTLPTQTSIHTGVVYIFRGQKLRLSGAGVVSQRANAAVSEDASEAAGRGRDAALSQAGRRGHDLSAVVQHTTPRSNSLQSVAHQRYECGKSSSSSTRRPPPIRSVF
jgi:hypothetical protein